MRLSVFVLKWFLCFFSMFGGFFNWLVNISLGVGKWNFTWSWDNFIYEYELSHSKIIKY